MSPGVYAAALPWHAATTWVTANTALTAGGGGVAVGDAATPVPPRALGGVLPAALVPMSVVACAVSVCSVWVTCAVQAVTLAWLATTLVLASAPPVAAAGLVTVIVPPWQ